MAYMDSYYVLSLNILKALGGDTSVTYPDADAIWDEINKIYDHAGNRFDIVPLEKIITENGQYDYYPDGNADAFMPVNIHVDVPQKYTDEQVFEIESNAIQQGYNQGYTVGESNGILIGQEQGYADGYNEGIEIQRGKLTTITITENGVYTREDGYNEVTVEVAGEGGITDEELQEMLKDAMDDGYQDGYADGVDDGMEEGYASGKVDGYNEGELRGAIIQKEKLTSLSVSENGTYTREDGYNEVIVEIETPTFVTESLNVELKENKTYTYTPTTDGYNSVSIKVDVPTSGGGDTGKPKIYNGFRLLATTGLNFADYQSAKMLEVDFTKYDWSGVYDLEEFFGGFTSNGSVQWNDSDFDNFRAGFNGEIISCKNMFKAASGGSSYVPLRFIPDFSMFTNNLTNCNAAFHGCGNLEYADNISKWNTSKVFDMSDMFRNCSKVRSIPLFDASYVLYATAIFYGCSSLTTVGGLLNLGKQELITTTNMFQSCTNLTHDSIMNIINNLYDRAAAGYSVATLPLGSTNLARISDDEKAIATNKGWTLS